MEDVGRPGKRIATRDPDLADGHQAGVNACRRVFIAQLTLDIQQIQQQIGFAGGEALLGDN
ncbi:hypothetical protein, partial [Klebsiella pneumoniae]|uniref:hypothetical protein n=1 Tax=Klebsiella pneumoniae TaxID=573 RepID=UPI003F821C54